MTTVSQRPLHVFAPGSLAPVRAALVDGFATFSPGTEVSFCPPAYSGVLAAEIQRGAPADVFISANPRYMDQLRQTGLVPRPAVLAGNALCLVVRHELAGQMRQLGDLLQPGPRLLIPPATTDPLGAYIEEMLTRTGFAPLLAAKRAHGEVLEELPSLSAWLAQGTVDAALVYCTAAPGLAPVAAAIPLPARMSAADRISFAVGAVVREPVPHPRAATFVDYLLAPAGQAVLLAAGFLPSPRRGTWPHPSTRC